MPIERPGPAFIGVSDVLDIEVRGQSVKIEMASWDLSRERAEMQAENAANRNPGPGILNLMGPGILNLGSQEFKAIRSEELTLPRRLVIKGFRVEVANQAYRQQFL